VTRERELGETDSRRRSWALVERAGRAVLATARRRPTCYLEYACTLASRVDARRRRVPVNLAHSPCVLPERPTWTKRHSISASANRSPQTAATSSHRAFASADRAVPQSSGAVTSSTGAERF